MIHKWFITIEAEQEDYGEPDSECMYDKESLESDIKGILENTSNLSKIVIVQALKQ